MCWCFLIQMEIVLKPKDAVNWSYRGEGAVNLVLAYTGTSPSFVSLFHFFFLILKEGQQKLIVAVYIHILVSRLKYG